MKTISTIIILTLTACSNPTSNQINENPQDPLVTVPGTGSSELKDTLRTSGDREYIDSANFRIIRGQYVSGAKFIEVYENKLTKLDSWKEYYENGQLKEEGFMTNAHHTYVGTWRYYSTTGKLDSVVDYDKKYSIPYFEALKIAETKGFKMPEVEITLTTDSAITFWLVARWTKNRDHTGQTAEAILIDTKTGKVTKPKYQLVRIY